MDIKQVRKKAKVLNVKTGKKTKADIIKEIQRVEGNFDCFGSSNGFCDQLKCAWRKDCVR